MGFFGIYGRVLLIYGRFRVGHGTLCMRLWALINLWKGDMTLRALHTDLGTLFLSLCDTSTPFTCALSRFRCGLPFYVHFTPIYVHFSSPYATLSTPLRADSILHPPFTGTSQIFIRRQKRAEAYNRLGSSAIITPL